MAINFKELLKERKVKNAIVVGAAAIGLVVFLYVMFGGSDSKEERNDKEIIVGDEASMLNFGVPTTKDSALIALNKQQAYERKMQDSVNFARQSSDALGLSGGESYSSNTDEGFTDNDFESMRKSALANSSSNSSLGSSSNSHSTYGNSSMWSNDVPSGSNVGYSDLGNVVERPAKKQKTQTSNYTPPTSYNDDVNTEIPQFPPQQNNSSYQNTQKSIGKSIRAKLVSSGYATSGRSLSFVLLETFTAGGAEVKKGQVITGRSIIKDNRLLVKFASMKINGKLIPANAYAVGYDGDVGLPISGTDNSENSAGEFARSEASGMVSSIPVVGGIISRATNGSRSSRNKEDKIELTKNVECQIVFN